jgi:hypothetical protein
MYKWLHGILALGMLSVLGFGYWSNVRAQEEQGGSTPSVQDHEVTGVIQAIDDTSVTIDGAVYQLTDQTQKEGLLQVGDTATLEFSINDDGTFTVREMSTESEIDSQDSTEQQDVDTDTDEQGEDLNEDQPDDETVQQGDGQTQGTDGGQEKESESSGSDD